MLANTLTVTINAVAKVLTRVNQDSYSSEYRLKTATESLILKVRNTTEKYQGYLYDRHNVDLSWIINATSTLPQYHYSASQTFRTRTETGDPTTLVQTVAGLATLVNAQAASIAQNES